MTHQYKKLPVTMKMWMQFNVSGCCSLQIILSVSESHPTNHFARQDTYQLMLFTCEKLLYALSDPICCTQHDLLYIYKIVFNLVSEAANDMFTLANTLYLTRTQCHPYTLYLHNIFIDVRKHFFCERIVITWNNLPATSEHFSSFSLFQYLINSVDLTSHVSFGFKYLVR